MQVSIDNTSFKGGFYIKRIPTNKLHKIISISNKPKNKLFDNFYDTKAKFLITDGKIDASILKMMQNGLVDYSYYPQISTCNFRNVTAEKIAKKIAGLLPDSNCISNILSVLNVNPTTSSFIDGEHGEKIVINNINQDRIHISPQNENGNNYVKIIPGKPSQSNLEQIQRYVINASQRLILKRYNADEAATFVNKYNNTLISYPQLTPDLTA